MHQRRVRWTSVVILLLLHAAVESWAASTTMTDAQLVTYGTAIRAQGDLADELANNDCIGITTWYNTLNSVAPTSAAFYVWKTVLTPDEYSSAAVMQPTDVAAMNVSAERAWEFYTGGNTRTVNPSASSFATVLLTAFPGTQTQTNLLAAARREATRVERLFATGTGSTGSPGTLAYSGATVKKDCKAALDATD